MTQPTSPRRAIGATPDPSEAPQPRRSASDADPSPAALVGSIPPPRARDQRPVLPGSPASAGRRYAASALPEGFRTAVPRRSATSPSQWDDDAPAAPRRSASSPNPRLEPGVPRRSATEPDAAPRRSAASPSPLEGGAPRRSATSPSQWDPVDRDRRSRQAARGEEWDPVPRRSATEADPRAASGRRGRHRWAPLALVLALTVLVAGAAVAWRSGLIAGWFTGGKTSVDLMLAADDLASLGSGWRATQSVAKITDTDPTPSCVPAAPPPDLPRAESSSLRTFAAEAGEALLNRVDTYATTDIARTAYTARVAQLGGCEAGERYLRAASTVLNLGDEATLVDVVAQEQPVIDHGLLVVRVGQAVSLVDLGQQATVDGTALARVVARLVAKQCAATHGACTQTPSLLGIDPPAGANPGFLGPADVPLVRPGSGRWVASTPTATVSLTGTVCEGIPLGSASGPLKRFQRTLVLTGDPQAPKTFGMDEVVLSFGDARLAADFAKRLTDNLTGCPARMATASVDKPTVVSSPSGALTATLYRLTQHTSTGAVPFRAAVVADANRVSYLVLTPTNEYTLSDAQWAAVALRAGERANELP